jgi:hypothetical protein
MTADRRVSGLRVRLSRVLPRQSLLLQTKHRSLSEATLEAIVTMRQAKRLVLIGAETEGSFGHSHSETPGAPVETPSPDSFRPGHPAGRRACRASKPGLVAQGPDLVAQRQTCKKSPAKTNPRLLTRRALPRSHPTLNLDPARAQ